MEPNSIHTLPTDYQYKILKTIANFVLKVSHNILSLMQNTKTRDLQFRLEIVHMAQLQSLKCFLNLYPATFILNSVTIISCTTITETVSQLNTIKNLIMLSKYRATHYTYVYTAHTNMPVVLATYSSTLLYVIRSCRFILQNWVLMLTCFCLRNYKLYGPCKQPLSDMSETCRQRSKCILKRDLALGSWVGRYIFLWFLHCAHVFHIVFRVFSCNKQKALVTLTD